MDAITEAYYKVKYPLTEAEQKELDEGLGGILAGGFGVMDYYKLREQGYTHLEAMAKAATQTLGGWGGAVAGGAVPVPGLNVATSIGGGMAGYEGGGWLYDKLTGRVNGRVPGSKAVLGGKPVVWGKDGRWEYPDGTPAQDEEGQTIAPPAGTPDQRQQDIEDLQTGTSDSPVETAAGLYQDDQEVGDAEEPEVAQQPQQPEQKLTPMQQWAKKFPKLAAKVKPGQAGYDEIQAMGTGSQAGAQGGAQTGMIGTPRGAMVSYMDQDGNRGRPPQQSSEPSTPSVAQRGQIDDATEKMRKNQEKYKDDLLKARQKQQIDRDIKTPGVRAASKVNDYSGKLKQVGNNVGKAFAGIPESYLQSVESDTFAKVDLLFEEAGVEEMTQEELQERFGWLSKFLRKAPQGWKWVTRNGKKVLQRIKGKGAQAADDVVKPGTTTIKRKPTITTKDGKILGPDGKPFPQRPTVTGTGGRIKKPGGKIKKPGKQKVDAPDFDPGQNRGGFPWRTAGNVASIPLGIAGGKYIWDNKDKIKNWLTGGGDGTTDPGGGTETQAPPVTQQPVTQQPVVQQPPKEVESPDPQPQISEPQTQAPREPRGRSAWRRPVGRREMIAHNNRSIRREDSLDGLMDELMETPKSEKDHTVTAKVIRRNARDGDEDLVGGQARRQFRSQALRGVKKPKPVKSPRKETRMPGEQLKDMSENLLTPAALEAAAKSQQDRAKKQGYKVPSTDSMKDVIDRLKGKKGQV